MKKVLKLHKKKIKKGGINVARVMHDNFCASNTPSGRDIEQCNCDPDITIINTDGSKDEINLAFGKKPSAES